jgi:D-alanine-D-alanine ligase
MSLPDSKPTVAILLGGVNSEREVSFETGQKVLEALLRLGYAATPVVYEGDLDDTIQIVKGFDLIFNALHGGEGEDGTVQAALEKAGIRYTGSTSRASGLAMDKQVSKEVMMAIDVPTPPWLMIEVPSSDRPVHVSRWPKLTEFLSENTYPVVVKPNHEGSTVGVSIVHSSEELDQALLVAREFGSQVLVERYIPGRELTVSILDQRPLPVVEIVPKHGIYDYECKYHNGMSAYHVPAELPMDITVALQEAARRLYLALECRHYARVDFRLDRDRNFFCLELNTLPGMTSHSLVPMAAQAAGISFDELIDRIVRLAMDSPRA